MEWVSVGELVRLAKGDDRSLREYARDSGVDAAILSKIINGVYLPKRPGIYEALTSPQASPRGNVTYQQLMEAAGKSDEYRSGMSAGLSISILNTLADVPTSVMVKVLQARGVIADSKEIPGSASDAVMGENKIALCVKSETQRFNATANGIILGCLGGKGLSFQALQTNGMDLDGIHFDTCVKLLNHEISDYLIRYVYFSEEEAASPALIRNTMRRMAEELVFLKPSATRKVSLVTNHSEAYDDLCAFKDGLSYNGELSVILFDLRMARIVQETYLSHMISEDPVSEILLV